MDDTLKKHATSTQGRYLDAVKIHGTQTAAAKALGVNRSTISQALIAVRKKAAASEPAEHDYTKSVPDGFAIKGVSHYIDKDGKSAGKWIKTDKTKARDLEIIKEALSGLIDDCRGLAAPIKAPRQKPIASELLTVYPWGDPHIGLYAWAAEAGDDFDLGIAESDLMAAVGMLVKSTPAANVGILANLGDMLHADNAENRTARAGHALDVDGRYAKVLRVAINILIHAVHLMLKKHKLVIVRNTPGNHDDHSAIMLSLVLEAYFKNEPRVQVDTSPALRWYYRFGRVFLGVVHGHDTKLADLGAIMAAERPTDWGATDFRHWLTGHVHHDQKVTQSAKEFRGWTGESFRTLAANDSWAASKGYLAGKDMKAITYHKEYGEQLRTTVGLQMVRAGRKS